MDEGIEGRMDEGRDGEKDEEKKNSTPEVIEKEAGKSKISPEIDPRGSQNRPKSVTKKKAKGTRNQSKVFKMILDPLGGDFPAILPRPGAKIEPKS